MLQRQLLVLVSVLVPCAAAAAQSFAFHVSPAQSSVQIDSSFSQDLPGTVIGDYDAVNNPTGTKTLPGIFGGSVNTAIPMDITFETALAYQGPPSGSFDAAVDVAQGTIAIDQLSLDALGGGIAQADLTLELLYSTFHTLQPTALFLGGIALPLPLGQASVSNLVFVQNAPALGVLVPDAQFPGTYAVTVLVPADVSFSVDLLGQVTPVGPLPAALPLVGTLVVNGGVAQLTLSAQQAGSQTIPDPFPGQTIDDFALAVPTILPPGGTANLLFDATFGELALDFASTFGIVADGLAVCAASEGCPTTPNTVGAGAHLDVQGTVSVSANDMVLHTSGLPAHRMTTVLFGNQARQVPFGLGTLCVGGTVYRLPASQSSLAGTADAPVDFSIPSQKYQALLPGTVWYFQCLYRDPSFALPPANTSNSVRVQFCP